MEFKGTKGNWKVDEYNNVSVGYNEIAFLNSSTPNLESRANAKLISKAPEMLEMLKILIQDIEEEGNYSRQTGYDLEEAKNLINEATNV